MFAKPEQKKTKYKSKGFSGVNILHILIQNIKQFLLGIDRTEIGSIPMWADCGLK
jgi:hypothetical protein